MAAWLEGTVVERKHWAGRLHSLRVEAPVASFEAGQFNRLALDIDGERVGRPYSYVNAPGQPPQDFYFITVPGGPLSNRLATLQSGDSIHLMSKAQGFFTLSEVPDGQILWLIATGTAIGPYLSMLRTDTPWRRFERVVLVHAVRTAEELTYREVIEGFRDYGRQFRFVPFVSREPHPGALPGRVTTALENGSLERHVDLPLAADTSQIMLCGNPDMVRDTTEVLKARGLRKNRRRTPGHITTEHYW